MQAYKVVVVFTREFHAQLIGIAVTTTEADEAIASSDFSKSWVFPSKKGANQGDSGQF